MEGFKKINDLEEILFEFDRTYKEKEFILPKVCFHSENDDFW